MWRGLLLIGAIAILPAALPAGAAAQQPCTADARGVVAEVYQRVLERGYDSRGENLVTQLTSGKATVREIVRGVARLPEHQRRFLSGAPEAGVTALYRHLLGREPDPEGLRGHIASVARDGYGPIIEVFVSSAEYAQNVGDYGVPGSSVRYCGPGQSSRAGARRNRFAAMDRNNDSSVAHNEWTGTAASFVVRDWNGDNVLSGEELTNSAVGTSGREDESVDPMAPTSFDTLDTNRNGRLERREWRASADAFDWLDRNNDNLLSRAEVVGNSQASDRFMSLDVNGDGRLTINEWDGTRRSFNRQDVNGDGVLTRREFNSSGAVGTGAVGTTGR